MRVIDSTIPDVPINTCSILLYKKYSLARRTSRITRKVMRRLLRKLSYTITESGVIWRLYWVSWRNALHQFRDIDVERHRQTVKGIAGNNGGCRIAVDPAQG